MTKIGSPKTANGKSLDTKPPQELTTGSPSALDKAIALMLSAGALGLMASLLVLKGGVQ